MAVCILICTNTADTNVTYNIIRAYTNWHFFVTTTIFWNNYVHTMTADVYWVPFQYPIRRLIERSREVSNGRHFYLELSDHDKIWQAPPLHCCRCACQISKRCDNLNCPSRAFARTSTPTVLYMQDKPVIVFYGKIFQFPISLLGNDRKIPRKKGYIIYTNRTIHHLQQ